MWHDIAWVMFESISFQIALDWVICGLVRLYYYLSADLYNSIISYGVKYSRLYNGESTQLQ